MKAARSMKTESMNTSASCCQSAAACSCARISVLLDTARLLAVSICVLSRIILPE